MAGGWQDVSEKILSLFQCPVFFQIFVKLDDFATVAGALATEFLRGIPSVHKCVDQLKAKDQEDNVPADAFSSLTDAAERVTKIMRFVGCLLNIKIEDPGVDPCWLQGQAIP